MILEELQVLITAKLDGLQQGIKASTSSLKSFSDAGKSTNNNFSGSVEKMNAAIEVLNNKMKNASEQADFQSQRLKKLQQQYAMASSAAMGGGDNPKAQKLQEEILKTEARINKFAETSNKAAEKLFELEDLLKKTTGAANSEAAAVNEATNAIDKNSRAVSEKGNALSKAASKASEFKEEAEVMGKGAEATNKNTKAVNEKGNALQRARSKLDTITASMKAALSKLQNFGSASQASEGKFRNMGYSLSNIGRQFLTWMVILPMAMKALEAITTFMGSALMTNSQFAASFNQIKSNLYTAFAPIYTAILPAINALMSGLSTVTAYIASFVSALFGKTYDASFGAAKALQSSIGAYSQQEKQAKKTADSLGGVKKAANAAGDALEASASKKGLAGFDQLNKLSENKSTTPAGSGVVDPITPMANMSPIEKVTTGWVNSFKKILGNIFAPFRAAWNAVGPSVTAEFNKAVEGTKATFSNFLNMLQTPAVQKFVQSVAELGLTIGKLFLFIYNNYFLPLINWLISNAPAVSNILTPIIQGITDFLNWLMGSGKPILDIIVTVVASMVASFLIVTTAVKGFIAVTQLIAVLTSPIGLIVIAIGLLIAAGVLLYQHWDAVKAKAGEVWNAIKETFQGFLDWINTVFSTDWSKRFGWLGDILNGFLATIRSIVNPIIQVFSGIIDFIAGVFTGDWGRAWRGVVEVFAGIADGLAAIIKAPLNAIIGLINAAISGLDSISVDIPDWVPGVGGESFGISIPKIPYLAKGGIVNRATMAVLGEAGTEAVVPLQNNTSGLDLLADKLFERMGIANSQASGSSDRPIELTINLGSSTVFKDIINGINKAQRQAGKTLIEV
ncbi:hypothetical protein IAI10_02030 [Clostridium sp. 19966]|uniref:hypothetical protein n=1 Tax=Clostridium sp. 19966 TaxID=2768166 RepID=UPI0028DEF024|nr:hypothetical protein [Clostridium sp. 19966]MDT8715435.1 hypothetical protein [Clostridium sp. 19966]